MKKLLIAVLTFLPIDLCAQYEIKLNDIGLIEFQEIIPMPDRSTSEIFTLCEKWIAYRYTNPDFVKLARIENEFLRGNGMARGAVLLDAINKTYANVYYKFEMRCKDEKVRLQIYDIRQGDIESESVNIAWITFKKGKFRKKRRSAIRTKEGVEEVVTALYVDFKEYLNNPESETDW